MLIDIRIMLVEFGLLKWDKTEQTKGLMWIGQIKHI
jgi:hypothetical protein